MKKERNTTYRKGEKMQSVSFQSVDEMLNWLPEDQLGIVERLRDLVLECIPDVEERLSFNVPFYRRHKAICFIWPGAVPWGSKTWKGVEFGFNYGSLLADEANYLERGKRKQVFSRRFYTLEEINEDLLRAYILEAAEIDELTHVRLPVKGF
jgi:hypothetical protein